MSNAEKTAPPADRVARALAQYQTAEGWFDKAVILIGAMRYTLALFVMWSIVMIWIGAVVFG